METQRASLVCMFSQASKNMLIKSFVFMYYMVFFGFVMI